MATNNEMLPPRDGCVAAAVFFPISHKLNDLGNIRSEHCQTAEDKEDHKEAAKGRLGENKIEIKSIFKIERENKHSCNQCVIWLSELNGIAESAVQTVLEH